VYDVSRLLHSGGMFIVEHMIGEEISRYVYGAYGLEVCKAQGYQHTVYAMKLLNVIFACELDSSKFKLLKPLIGDKVNTPSMWQI
jgi:hypothetical protein